MIILEKLGIPENLINSAKKLWDETIVNLNKNYNNLIKKGEISYRVSDIKIGEFDIKETNIFFNLNIINSLKEPSIDGMSIGSRTLRKSVNKITYITSDPINIYVYIVMGPSNNKEDLINFIVEEKIKIISSFAHELKHKYDFTKRDTHDIKSEISYIDLDDFLSKVKSMNEFFYFMYYSHSVENLVRLTEVGAAIQVSGIDKSDFLDFLKSNRTYSTLDEMSKYNIEDFKSKLKEDHDKIKETLEKLDIPRGTESENINNILRVFLIALIEYKISKLKDHLRSLPKLVLSFGHSELDKILDYIDKNYSKFKNNPIEFFENQIKNINLVGNKYKKKLSKLYDTIEDYPMDMGIHRTINRKINNFKDFKND